MVTLLYFLNKLESELDVFNLLTFTSFDMFLLLDKPWLNVLFRCRGHRSDPIKLVNNGTICSLPLIGSG